MITLRDKATGDEIGAITEEQLQFLVDELVEEDSDDQDYYIDRDTLEMLEDKGMDPSLLAMLSDAMGGRNEIEVQWERS